MKSWIKSSLKSIQLPFFHVFSFKIHVTRINSSFCIPTKGWRWRERDIPMFHVSTARPWRSNRWSGAVARGRVWSCRCRCPSYPSVLAQLAQFNLMIWWFDGGDFTIKLMKHGDFACARTLGHQTWSLVGLVVTKIGEICQLILRSFTRNRQVS